MNTIEGPNKLYEERAKKYEPSEIFSDLQKKTKSLKQYYQNK